MRLRRIARHEGACRHIAGNAGTGGNHRLVADAQMIGHHADGERKVERPFSSRGMHEAVNLDRAIAVEPARKRLCDVFSRINSECDSR